MTEGHTEHVWAAAMAFAATYPPTVVPSHGSRGLLVDVRVAVDMDAGTAQIEATYRSALGASKTHRLVTNVEQLVREYRMGFTQPGGDDERFSSALLFAQSESVLHTFGWNLAEDEVVEDTPP